MVNDKWNECERKCYERLSKTGNGKDPEGIDGLAYTAVCEMYMNRIDRERNDKFRDGIMYAIGEMSEGICILEDRLGFSIGDLARDHFADRFNKLRKETKAICEVLYAMRREYVDMTTARGPIGDNVGTCRTIKVNALEDFIGRICKAIGLEWKDVVSYAEECH